MTSLKRLKLLDMDFCCEVNELPEWIGELTNLSTLRISGCNTLKAGLRSVPTGMRKLQLLTALDLEGCARLDELPQWLGELVNLTTLKLDGCWRVKKRMKVLPAGMKNLGKLTMLDLEACSNLEGIPEWIGALTSLTCLRIDGCTRLKENLKALPTGLCNLKLLQTLDLHDCMALEEIPDWVGSLSCLSSIVLSGCSRLKKIPTKALVRIDDLKYLDCTNCFQLWSPPQEVCNQGPEATMNFLREVHREGTQNTDMTLFLVGDGEAGKTSVIKSLTSKSNRADYIRADHRTIGIDISEWEPEESAKKLKFTIYDLAGQAVYSKTHQFFLLRRAVYVFVWRAGEIDDLPKTIRYWLSTLQTRMPGSYIVLVVTHIDLVDDHRKMIQCKLVKDTVTEWMREHESINSASMKAGTPMLQVLNDGDSFQVNCISGDGVPEFRRALIDFTEGMPWCCEDLPKSWIEFKKALLVCKKESKIYLSWQEYADITSRTPKCEMTSQMLESATRFLHDTGFIRYFGRLKSDVTVGGVGSEVRERQNIAFSAEGNAGEQYQTKGATLDAAVALQSTVFISFSWIMNIMKGLMRHDRQALIDFFLETKDKVMLRRTNRLNVCGKLHKDLVPYLWPTMAQSKEFWDFVRDRRNRESEVWKEEIITTQEECDRAMALLKGFDLVAEIDGEYLVPGILPPSDMPSEPALDVPECPSRARFGYNALPPGSFDTIAVRMAKIMVDRGMEISVEFTSYSAVFYSKTAESKDIAQFLRYKVRSDSVKASSSTNVPSRLKPLADLLMPKKQPVLERMPSNLEIPSQENIVVEGRKESSRTRVGELLILRFSSRELFELAYSEVGRMEGFFAGLVRLTAECPDFEVHVPTKKGGNNTRTSAKSGFWNQSRSWLIQNSLLGTWQDETLIEGDEATLMASYVECPKCPDRKAVHKFKRSECEQKWDHFISPSFEKEKYELRESKDEKPVGCLSTVKQSKREESDIVVCPKCKNESTVVELLTLFRVPELRTCPSCQDHETSSPFTFSTGECRLRISERDHWRRNTVTCPRCLTSRRLGQIRVVDVAPPELFVAGLGVIPGSMKDAVDHLIANIELEADVLCCNRFGDEEISERMQVLVHSREHEKLLRLEESKFVILLLTDKFLVSSECRAEFIATIRSCRRLIPILITDRRHGDDCIWTGADTDDYWKHAIDYCNGSPVPLQPKVLDWTFLKPFSPLVFSDTLHFSRTVDAVPQSVNLAVEVAGMIKDRLQRPGKIDVYSDFPSLGVRLEYFEKFIEQCGGREKLLGLTTTAVNQRFVMPWTKESKLSLCDYLTTSEGQKHFKDGKAYVAKANWFYSHAWKFRFLDVVDAAHKHFKNDKDGDHVIWFDLFSVSQHNTENRPFEWWNTTFLNAIGKIGKVLMLMQPYADKETNTPAWTTLTRVWCVFELYACESTTSELHVTMTDRMSERFVGSLSGDASDLLMTIKAIKCERSEAFNEDDKRRVFDAVNRTIGFPLLNSMVILIIEKWIYSELLAMLQAKQFEVRTKCLYTMKTLCEACLKRRIKNIGLDHPDTRKSKENLARIYKLQQESDRAGNDGQWPPAVISSATSSPAGAVDNSGMSKGHNITADPLKAVTSGFDLGDHAVLANQFAEECLEEVKRYRRKLQQLGSDMLHKMHVDLDVRAGKKAQ